MHNKKIYRFTHVELLDVIKNANDPELVELATSEFNSRNLSEEKLTQVETDYLKFKRFQRSRKSEPLTREEWLTFFILPFFTPRPMSRDDHFSGSELNRFVKYGFEEKYKQAQKVKRYGMLFWFVIIVCLILIFS